MITFHEAEFAITDGYYVNEGRNDKINDAINNLYDLRLNLKETNDKSPAQVVIKMMMSSMHGNTTIKPVETDSIIEHSRDDFEKCTSLKYNYIDNVLEVNGWYHMKILDQSWLISIMFIVGVEVLSMSKRIMNKVFSCASDLEVKTYHQDTDSIHLTYDDVDKVVEIY